MPADADQPSGQSGAEPSAQLNSLIASQRTLAQRLHTAADTAPVGTRWRALAQSYPELLLFRDDLQRAKAFRGVESAERWSYFALMLVVLIAAPYLCDIIRQYAPFARWPSGVLLCLIIAPLSALFAVVAFVLNRGRCRRVLRRRLVDFGIPVCLACGYDLRGQIEPRCPECGTRFNPRLLADRSQAVPRDNESGRTM